MIVRMLRYITTETEGCNDLLIGTVTSDLTTTWVAGEVFVTRCFAEVEEEEGSRA
jgi:hypothetical protein